MSWTSGLAAAGISAGGGLIGGLISANQNRIHREWASKEAVLDRQFQMAEAEKARQFTENFYQQYQSPQALIAQGREAGIHPMVAMGHSPSSGASSPMPSGSRAGIPQQYDIGSQFSNTINSALGFLEAKSRIDLNNNLGNLYQSQSKGQDIKNSFSPSLFQLDLERGRVDIDNMLAGIENLNSNTSYTKQKTITEVSQDLVNRKNADYIVQQTNKSILEQATERLKQQGQKITNKKLATEITNLNLEQGLIVAKTLLTKYNQGESQTRSVLNTAIAGTQTTLQNLNIKQGISIQEDTFKKQWERQYRADFGVEPDVSLWNGLLQLIGSSVKYGQGVFR